MLKKQTARQVAHLMAHHLLLKAHHLSGLTNPMALLSYLDVTEADARTILAELDTIIGSHARKGQKLKERLSWRRMLT